MSQRESGEFRARGVLVGATLVFALVWAGAPVRGGVPAGRVAQVSPDVPRAFCDPASDREIVPIPGDWKARYPFSARFEQGDQETPEHTSLI